MLPCRLPCCPFGYVRDGALVLEASRADIWPGYRRFALLTVCPVFPVDQAGTPLQATDLLGPDTDLPQSQLMHIPLNQSGSHPLILWGHGLTVLAALRTLISWSNLNCSLSSSFSLFSRSSSMLRSYAVGLCRCEKLRRFSGIDGNSWALPPCCLNSLERQRLRKEGVTQALC